MMVFMLLEFINVRVSILGGLILMKWYMVNGVKVYNDVLIYNVDIVFVLCWGIDYDKGVMEIYEGEVFIK